MAVRIQEAASMRLDEIYRYTRDRWGADQADRYITDLFAAFDRVEGHGVASRPIPAEFGVEGFYFRHAQHVTILHERMHKMDRFSEDRGK
jgi:toxin ParE1/3/4